MHYQQNQMLYNIQLMEQIRLKIKLLTQAQTKKSYQNAIKFLTNIIQWLLTQNGQGTKFQQSKRKNQQKDEHRRVYSESKKNLVYSPVKIPELSISNKTINQKLKQQQSSRIIQNSCSFEGSQISFIQNLNKKLAQQPSNYEPQQQQNNKQKNSNELSRLNKRKIQSTIQIYHQCLSNCIKTIKLQHKYIMAQSKKSNTVKQELRDRQIMQKLDQFWQKYNKGKKQCKSFNSLTQICQKVLAQQFLTILNPFNISVRYKYNKNKLVQYVVYL